MRELRWVDGTDHKAQGPRSFILGAPVCSYRSRQPGLSNYVRLKYHKPSRPESISNENSNTSNVGVNNNQSDSLKPSWGLPFDEAKANKTSDDNSMETSHLTPSWGLGDDLSGTPSWGIGQAPSWAKPVLEESEMTNQSTQSRTQSSEMENNEPTVYKKFIQEDQPKIRLINLPPFPGPESSRAGRPIPFSRSQVKQKENIDQQHQRIKSSTHNFSKNERRFQTAQAPSRNIVNQFQTRESGSEPQWSKLRKRASTKSFRDDSDNKSNLGVEETKIIYETLKRRSRNDNSYRDSDFKLNQNMGENILKWQKNNTSKTLNKSFSSDNDNILSSDLEKELRTSFNKVVDRAEFNQSFVSLTSHSNQEASFNNSSPEEFGYLHKEKKLDLESKNWSCIAKTNNQGCISSQDFQKRSEAPDDTPILDNLARSDSKIPPEEKLSESEKNLFKGSTSYDIWMNNSSQVKKESNHPDREKNFQSKSGQNLKISMSNLSFSSDRVILDSNDPHKETISDESQSITASVHEKKSIHVNQSIFSEPSFETQNLDKTGVVETQKSVHEEPDSMPPSKRKKEKKRRGVHKNQIFADELGKLEGKNRDKAKREAQFLRNQELELANQIHREEKMERQRLKAEKKAARKAARKAAPVPILLPEFISISNLAVALKVRYEDLATKMVELGFEKTNSDLILNSEISGLIAMEYNFEPILDKNEDEMDLKAKAPHPNPIELPQRPPIITIMGHVDHGKTTLLDYLRKSSIAASEHGGITQHIGAFSVRMHGDKIMTFLDTPGHEAFLSMRKRGAHVTDIVVLVVAADDGVKPQTLEAIKHAKSANVPMIVAVTKIDKPDVNIEEVKQELARYDVGIEDIGGDTQVVCVSGKTGEGIENFKETLTALTEILDVRAEKDCPSECWVLEASVKPLGKIATVLVRRGTLRPGQILVAGTSWTKVRTLLNEAGSEVEEATPGIPVQVDGWRELPVAGDEVLQAQNESMAKRVVEYRIDKIEREKLASDMEAINSLRDESRQLKASRDAEIENKNDENNRESSTELAPSALKNKTEEPKKVHFIIKGDVSGSVETVQDQIRSLKTKEVESVILRSGVGKVSEFDIEHASAAKGHVICFNLKVDPEIHRLAQNSQVKIFENNIIYALIDSVRDEMSNYLPRKISYSVLGECEIMDIFIIKLKHRKTLPVAGCRVKNGLIKRNGKVRVFRNKEKIFQGKISSLKLGKKDALEVNTGNECGLAFEEWSDFQVGDHIQYYEEISEKRFL